MKKALVFAVLAFVVVLTGCSKDEPIQPELNPMDYYLEALSSSRIDVSNDDGLVCTISSDDLITSGGDCIINYTIENTSPTDFNEKIFIVLSVERTFTSFLWWEQPPPGVYGHTVKQFELAGNSTFTQSVNCANIEWNNAFSSTLNYSRDFHEMVEAGNLEFNFHLFVYDSNDPSSSYAIVSNTIEIVKE